MIENFTRGDRASACVGRQNQSFFFFFEEIHFWGEKGFSTCFIFTAALRPLQRFIFIPRGTTGSTSVRRGPANTRQDALRTYSSKLCLCSFLGGVRVVTGRPNTVLPGSWFLPLQAVLLGHRGAAPRVDAVHLPGLEAPAAGRRAGPPRAGPPARVAGPRRAVAPRGGPAAPVLAVA